MGRRKITGRYATRAELQREVKGMYQLGLSDTVIARRAEVSPATVAKLIKEPTMDNLDPTPYQPPDDSEGATMDNHQRRGPRPQRNPGTEVVDRLRRIETRVTQIAIATGASSDHQKPVFDPGALGTNSARITVPSRHTSLQEILDSIPKGWQGCVGVFIGDEPVTVLAVGNLPD